MEDEQVRLPILVDGETVRFGSGPRRGNPTRSLEHTYACYWVGGHAEGELACIQVWIPSGTTSVKDYIDTAVLEDLEGIMEPGDGEVWSQIEEAVQALQDDDYTGTGELVLPLAAHQVLVDCLRVDAVRDRAQ